MTNYFNSNKPNWIIYTYLQLEYDYDYVEFRNGYDYNTLIAKLTGQGPKADVQTPSRYTLIYFHTDGSVENRGFNISFSASKEYFHDYSILHSHTAFLFSIKQ